MKYKMNEFEVILYEIKMEWLSCQSTILSQAGKRSQNLICYIKHYIVLKYIISYLINYILFNRRDVIYHVLPQIYLKHTSDFQPSRHRHTWQTSFDQRSWIKVD